MKLIRFATVLATLSLLCLCPVLSSAQGIILPRPCNDVTVRCAPPEWQRPLKVKSIKLNTKITEQAAVTKIEQIFVNESPLTLEGTYFFPLPDNVSIGEFAMWDGDKRLQAEFRSREEARRIYDTIVRSRRDPALLEYAGKNLFQASIFPIAPHSEKKIELTYSQILTGEAGTVGYRYPLGTGWRANGFAQVQPMPRPQPRPMPRPMPRVMPPSDPPHNTLSETLVSGVIEIDSRIALKGVYSPSHDIELKREGERKARITFEQRGVTTQPDFQLYYTFSEQDFGVSLLTHREPGKDGYFMLLVAPKATLDRQQTAAKEVVFVVDTSGSMSDDDKIGKAKAALRFGIQTLNARDRFNIISFAGEEHLFSAHPVSANDEGRQRATEFINNLKATGGTNINDAMLAGLKQLAAPAQQRNHTPILILLTDGQPTVGVTQASKIIANATQANASKARIFTFGVGYDVNTLLLDALANDNRGAAAYIEPKEDLEIKVSSFFSKVNNPVLSDVQLDWGGLTTDMIYPRTLPDIFHGEQLVLVGRYRLDSKSATNKSTVRLALSGKVNGQERRFPYDNLHFPETQRAAEFLPQLWAMRRVGYLLDQIKLNGEAKELRDEVIALGTRYGIVTPYTSALVLEPGMNIAMAPPPKPASGSQIRNLGIGGGTGNVSDTVNVVGAAPAAAPSAKATAVAGREAVQQSKSNATLRKADNLQTNAQIIAIQGEVQRQQAMNQIANKTFYQIGNGWNDSEYNPAAKLPEIKLKFASDAYYQLLKDEPKLAEFFAQGTTVTVVWNNKVYLVTE